MTRGRFALLLGVLAVSGTGCTFDAQPASDDRTAEGPRGPYALRRGSTVPNLEFEGVDGRGQRATIRLHDAWTPDEDRAQLLVMLVSGGLWCGTCRWTAEHFGEIAERIDPARITRIDVVLRDRDNAEASADRDAAAWQTAVGAEGSPVVVDPAFTLGEVLEGVRAPLPLVLVLDRRTMVLEAIASNPDPSALTDKLRATLARLDGEAAPKRAPVALVDGLFFENEWDMLEEMAKVPSAPPADPTNAVADSPAAVALGEALFFDAGLSPSGTVSCATCHDPAKGLTDGRPLAEGAALGTRRTPSITLAAHARWQDWDGKADTLWAQALGPLENPKEFASSRTFVARRVITAHASAYAAAFPGSALPDPSAWPSSGRPGDPTYDALPEDERETITEVFVHVGKALAAYERTFRVSSTTFDRYVQGDRKALSEEEKYGLLLFVRSGCTQCHWGPRLTDDAFHDTGSARPGSQDTGRFDGVERWTTSEFRADGRWSDVPADGAPAPSLSSVGQFRTPSLRGVADLAFLGHDGSHAGLASVTEAYGKGNGAEPWLAPFTETGQWGLVPFLKTLTAE
jgi:cytochrome c peroxidase